MSMTRRHFLHTCAALPFGSAAVGDSASNRRRFEACLSVDALDADPDLITLVREAGVSRIWLPGFLYGYWPYTLERLRAWRSRIEQAGLQADVVNVPLGHPGDSLGAMTGGFPLTPPARWKMGTLPDGGRFAGTSLHPPAVEENIEALHRLQAEGTRRVFLDDDYRLARGPGIIGGCFCDEHRAAFLRQYGYSEAQWAELLDAVRRRERTPLLEHWVAFQCDALTAAFRAQRKAAPNLALGIMVMYLGAEKAGIRLADYRDAPFRVGELMFDDGSFSTAKGKTNELFSALFHRRYAAPERACSETTAFPADRLSARNMAAKLAVSTLADVRTTLFMSGLTPFPRTHWQTLGPAMKRQRALHERVAGHTPRGPFKHFWGDDERMVGNDDPLSLFLATGVPFEVTGAPARDGWTFLGAADGKAAASGRLRSPGTVFVARPGEAESIPQGRSVAETLGALFDLKRQIAPRLDKTPYVEEDRPAVCAWYPTARLVVLWNLSETREALTLRMGTERRHVEIDGLDTAAIELGL